MKKDHVALTLQLSKAPCPVPHLIYSPCFGHVRLALRLLSQHRGKAGRIWCWVWCFRLAMVCPLPEMFGFPLHTNRNVMSHPKWADTILVINVERNQLDRYTERWGNADIIHFGGARQPFGPPAMVFWLEVQVFPKVSLRLPSGIHLRNAATWWTLDYSGHVFFFTPKGLLKFKMETQWYTISI